jgi:hypothetical protein
VFTSQLPYWVEFCAPYTCQSLLYARQRYAATRGGDAEDAAKVATIGTLQAERQTRRLASEVDVTHRRSAGAQAALSGAERLGASAQPRSAISVGGRGRTRRAQGHTLVDERADALVPPAARRAARLGRLGGDSGGRRGCERDRRAASRGVASLSRRVLPAHGRAARGASPLCVGPARAAPRRVWRSAAAAVRGVLKCARRGRSARTSEPRPTPCARPLPSVPCATTDARVACSFSPSTQSTAVGG